MINPIDGQTVSYRNNVTIWVQQAKGTTIGGTFITVSGTPSQQLLPTLNTNLNYMNGQMLATAIGDGSGGYAGLTAGALINWDPNSSDTGQAVFNKMIICDPSIKAPFQIYLTGSTPPYNIFNGSVTAAIGPGWFIMTEFLYGPGTPLTDVSIVQTAIANAGLQQTAISGPNLTSIGVVILN